LLIIYVVYSSTYVYRFTLNIYKQNHHLLELYCYLLCWRMSTHF